RTRPSRLDAGAGNMTSPARRPPYAAQGAFVERGLRKCLLRTLKFSPPKRTFFLSRLFFLCTLMRPFLSKNEDPLVVIMRWSGSMRADGGGYGGKEWPVGVFEGRQA